MNITARNVNRTFNELRGISPLIGETRTLVARTHAGSAQPMSPAELEFAIRNTTNGLIALYNAFLGFLERVEHDSRQHR